MVSRDRIYAVAGRLLSAIAFGGSIAAAAILIGVRDFESYELSFVSLDRGTAARAVDVLGHPVYTLALGLGVRLPLHGSLGASPAAAVAPYLPMPLTYWCLLTFSIGAAVMVVRHALEPLCGRAMSWLAMVLLFCSVPIVNYTIYDDWPETAVTYCAIVACVFAPHALLALRDSRLSANARRIASLSLAGLVWGLIGASHPGYWPLLAVALIFASILALFRSTYSFRTRMGVVIALAAISLMAVGLQVPDIMRELTVASAQAGGMSRSLQGPQGSVLVANMFPFGSIGVRMPFMYLVLSVVSLVIGLTSHDAQIGRLTVGSALVSLVLGLGASTMSPWTSTYAPSATWALRDPATAFAVFSGAGAARLLWGSLRGHRFAGAGPAVVLLVLAGLQGPAYAARLVFEGGGSSRNAWTKNSIPPGERASKRGLSRDLVPPGERLALWPGASNRMRNLGRASTDFADAGYPLVTAFTKQRTMSGVVQPNERLFNQTTQLSSQVLCNADAVTFLQLRYLLLPPEEQCPPWTRVPDMLVDGQFDVAARERDDRVWAIPLARVSGQMGRTPALSPDSVLLSSLVPLSGTSLKVDERSLMIRLNDPSMAAGQALVLPVAYDPAWRASAGQVRSIGGLLALVEVNQPRVTLGFVPDVVAVLRAVSMTLAQVLAAIGFIGLACVRPLGVGDPRSVVPSRSLLEAAYRVVTVITPVLRSPRSWFYLAYIAAVMQRLEWRPEDSGETRLLTALLLPTAALVVARLTRSDVRHRLIGATLLAFAVLRVSIGGSGSPEALHDPLFWSLTAAVACGASLVTGRWPLAALTASAVAGACAVIATLLPWFADFDAAFPIVDIALVRQAFGALSSQLGIVATMALLILWIDAIVIGEIRGRSKGRAGAAARGALFAALALTLAGAMPDGRIEAAWLVSLGVLVGLGSR